MEIEANQKKSTKPFLEKRKEKENLFCLNIYAFETENI